MEITEIDRSAESQFQRTAKQALASRMNLVYTTVQRSGVTTALETMDEHDVFGNDYVRISPSGVLGKRDGGIYLRHLPSLDRLSPTRRNTVFVVDAASRMHVRAILNILMRDDYGSVLLFDPDPSPAVVSAMAARPVIHACDPSKEAWAAKLGPQITRATTVTGKTLCVTPQSQVGRTLSLAVNMLEGNDPVRHARGRYLLYLTSNLIAHHAAAKIVIGDPDVLNNDFVLRSLCQAVTSRSVSYASYSLIENEYNADVHAFGLYQKVNAELDLYVSKGTYREDI